MAKTMTIIGSVIRGLLAAPERQRRCRRGICRRLGQCVPPPDPGQKGLYRCPAETREAWVARIPAVYLFTRRLSAAADKSCLEPRIPEWVDNPDAAVRLRCVMNVPSGIAFGPIPKTWEKDLLGPERERPAADSDAS